MSKSIRLLSLQVGLPRDYGRADAAAPEERAWSTAFFKQPVAGPVAVGPAGLAGDGVADLRHHGGPDKAVLAYASEHFPLWRAELGLDAAGGGFGENFTLAGATEAEVCIGDVFALGTARFQVTQPRQPCWKLARRWGVADLVQRVQDNGRCGWYLRVLVPGAVEAGQELRLLERPRPEWSVARAHDLMHHRRDDRAAARALAACPELSATWRATMERRAG